MHGISTVGSSNPLNILITLLVGHIVSMGPLGVLLLMHRRYPDLTVRWHSGQQLERRKGIRCQTLVTVRLAACFLPVRVTRDTSD